MNMANSINALLKPYIKKINGSLTDLIESKKPEKLYKYVGYQLGLFDENMEKVADVKGGKRLRASIPLIVTKHIGDGEFAMKVAMALELFHNFTLIVDDIQDNDETRRGRPTLWKTIDRPQALNAALVAESLAFECAREASAHLPTKQAQKWYESFQMMTAKVFEGQHLDILFEKEEQVFSAQYIQMIMAKTACLLGQAFSCGFALQAKEDLRKYAANLKQIGEAAGMAFQIQDDILGLWGDPKKTGKPVGSDLKRHKKTLPVVHALEYGSRSARQIILEAYQKDLTDKQTSSILNSLEVAGSKEFAFNQVREYTNKALSILDATPIDAKLKEKLTEIIEALGHRES